MPMINLANVISSCCHSIGTATATKDARSKGITLPNDNPILTSDRIPANSA